MTNDQFQMTDGGVALRRDLCNVPKALIHLTFVIGSLIFCLLNQSFGQTAFDPLNLAVGTRALGMGGACAAVADDGNTLFNNPAALGEIDKVKLTSLSATLQGDVNCTVLGGILPFGDRFAVGAGYAGAFVTGIELRDSYGAPLGRGDYGSSVLVLAAGQKLSDRSSLGLKLKYYFSDGTGAASGNGRGWNLSLGILQSGWNWLKLGLVGENILGNNRISYSNGSGEPLPLTVKSGLKVYLMGGGFDSAFVSPLEVNLVADADYYPQGSSPLVLHEGIEVAPVRFLALRAGLDGGNPTAGLSFRCAGLGFHYAYHTYGDFSGSAVNYFSLSYDEGGFPTEPEVPDVYLAEGSETCE
jgi:hypothetical protein